MLTNGKVVVGQTMHVKADHIKARSNALSQQPLVVARDNIEESFPAKVSPMPPGLVDVLSQSQIYDLLVYLQAEGDPTHEAFQKEQLLLIRIFPVSG